MTNFIKSVINKPFNSQSITNPLMKTFFPFFLIILILLITPGCSSVAIPSLVPTIDLPSSAKSTVAQKPEMTPPASNTEKSTPIWVANPSDRTVLRIDPSNNTVTNTIPIEGRPDIAVVGEGAVWLLDRQHKLVFRIDPSTNRMTASIPLPAGDASTLTVGGGAVWVGMTGKADLSAQPPGAEEDVVQPGMVVQIDPHTNAVLKQFPVQPVNQMVISSSSLWVLSHAVIDTPVQLIDLKSKQGMAMPFSNAPGWLPADALAVDTNNLWLFSSAYSKIFRATLDGHINSIIDLDPHQPTGSADLLLTGSSLWAATPWGSVLRIDPNTNHIQVKIDLNIPLSGLIAGDNAVWVLSQQTATLYRINLDNNTVAAQIKTGSILAPTVVPSPTPRVVIWKPCPDGPTSRLKVGDLAYVTKDPPIPNRVRKEPKPDAEILGYINPGASMELLEGPACANGWVWWRVKNADLNGWTAEGDNETYWLVPLFQ